MAFCVNCGTSLPQGALFCPKCGADLRQWMQPSAPRPEIPVQEFTVPAQATFVCQPPIENAAPAVKSEPGAGAVKAGRILSVLGFALSVFIFAASYVFVALTMSLENILRYKDLVFNIASVAAQALALSSFGLVFSRQGEKKGAPKAALGKRFGWIGFVLSLIALVNVILILIAFAFSGSILTM